METKKATGYGYEETMVTLTDENGQTRDYYVDEIYEAGGRLYAAVIPSDEENITEYLVYRLNDLGNDDYELEDINSQKEYDRAADAYEELLEVRAWNMAQS